MELSSKTGLGGSPTGQDTKGDTYSVRRSAECMRQVRGAILGRNKRDALFMLCPVGLVSEPSPVGI